MGGGGGTPSHGPTSDMTDALNTRAGHLIPCVCEPALISAGVCLSGDSCLLET